MESSECLTGNGPWVQFSPGGSLDGQDHSELSPREKLREGMEHHYTTARHSSHATGQARRRTDTVATCSGSKAGLPEMLDTGAGGGESGGVRGGSQKLRAWSGGLVLP